MLGEPIFPKLKSRWIATRPQRPAHLLGFGWMLAWLAPWRDFPLLTFYNEWLALAALLTATLWARWLNLRTRHDVEARIPASALASVPVLFAGAAFCAIHPESRGAFILAAISLAAFSGATIAGANWRHFQPDSTGAIVAVLATWTVRAALASSAIVIIQFLEWDTVLYPWVRSVALHAGDRPYGNLAQPNHLSLLLMLGVASVGYRWLSQKAGNRLAAGQVIFLLVGLGLANTRAALLMLLPLVAACYAVDPPRRRSLLWWSLLVIPLALVVALALYPQIMAAMGYAGGRPAELVRGAQDARLLTWQASIEIIRLAPWAGTGLGQFATGFYEVVPLGFGRLGHTGNAHNIFLHLAAEAGIPVAALLAVALLLWLAAHVRSQLPPNRLYALTCVGMMLAHSLVEFPLWSLYFLIPAGFMAGILDASRCVAKTGEPSELTRTLTFKASWMWTLFAGNLAAGACAIWVLLDYRRLSEDFEGAVLVRSATYSERVRNEYPVTVFSIYQDYARFVSTPVTPENARQQMALGGTLIRRFPFPFGVIHYVYATLEANAVPEALSTLNTLNHASPRAYAQVAGEIRYYCQSGERPSPAYCAVNGQLAPPLVMNK